MRNTHRISLSLAALAIAIPLVGWAPKQQPGAQLVGKALPKMTMTDLAGKKHTNQSLRGKVVLLDFWASWCGPCKAASPTMQALHTKYAKQGLVVIGANAFESGDSRKAAAAYAKEHKYTYTFTHGNDKFAESLGVTGLPFFVFVDRKGVVRKVYTGFGPRETPAEFEAEVKRLLAQK